MGVRIIPVRVHSRVWRGRCMELFDQLAIKKLEIVFLEVLGPAEEGVFRKGKAFGRTEFGSGEFKCANYVCGLEQSIMRGLHRRHELCARRENSKRFLKKFGEFGLSVVVIHFQGVKCGEKVCVRNQKTENLLKKRIVDFLVVPEFPLVDFKADIRDVGQTEKSNHTVEYSSARFSTHICVFFFATNKWPCMNTMIAGEPHAYKCFFNAFEVRGYVLLLVVKYHADEVESRCGLVLIKCAGLVYENADVFCAHMQPFVFETTKARISPRPRQETFPHAGDLGYSPLPTHSIAFPDVVYKGAKDNFKRAEFPSLGILIN